MSIEASVGADWSRPINVNEGVEETSSLLSQVNQILNILSDCEGQADSINSSQDKPGDPTGPIEYYSLRQAVGDMHKRVARLREVLTMLRKEIGAL